VQALVLASQASAQATATAPASSSCQTTMSRRLSRTIRRRGPLAADIATVENLKKITPARNLVMRYKVSLTEIGAVGRPLKSPVKDVELPNWIAHWSRRSEQLGEVLG
jgi:hypothetical protein